MAYRYFVVREEGGKYEFMSKRRWQRQRPNVPVWGFIKDNRVYAFDRIILRNGWGTGHRSRWQDFRQPVCRITHPSQMQRSSW